MAKTKRYIDTNVYDEAKNRIRHVFNTFDTIVVCFSGGKDSLATLHLVKEIRDELGITDKVNVIFRDEELIHTEVLDFVDEYRRMDWVNLLWFCIPLASKKYVMGVVKDYIQWDNSRAWVRPKPEYSITLPETDRRVFDQYNCDAYVATFFKGKVALVNGIRASESLIRYRASVNKLTENYINAVPSPQAKNVKLVKPIFDWQEDDVFKYFYDKGIRYCPLYNNQMFSQQSLRVSTPCHAESAKQFHKLRSTSATLYQQVVTIFPDMVVQERYFKDYDRKSAIKECSSLGEIKAWIIDNIKDPAEFNLAKKRFNSVVKRYKKYPSSYALKHILTQFINGSYKREILLDGKNHAQRTD